MEPINDYGDEPNPFEKVLGDSPELRILQELLPFAGRKNVDNDETWLSFEDIAEVTGIKYEEFIPAISLFKRFGMILTKTTKCPLMVITEYALDKNSPVVQAIIDFDNTLIGVIVEEELKDFEGNPT